MFEDIIKYYEENMSNHPLSGMRCFYLEYIYRYLELLISCYDLNKESSNKIMWDVFKLILSHCEEEYKNEKENE